MRTLFTSYGLLLCGMSFLPWGSPVEGADPPSAVGPLLGLLQKGTLPPERLPGVVALVCQRGNEHDLGYVLEQAVSDRWTAELRRQALESVREAVVTRKVRPAAGTAGLAAVLSTAEPPALREAAVRLAGALHEPGTVAALQALAAEAGASAKLRAAAVDALIAFGGDVARQTAEQLLAAEQPLVQQMRGVAALVALDPEAAGAAAARVLRSATPRDDPAPVIDAFLNVKGGADRLAAALRVSPPAADVALLSLRHMYAVGRSDAALDAVLSELAGIRGEAPRLTDAEIKATAERAAAQGDAARGEAVFRRADLACMRCHAVSKAGGQIGPDLSSVGVSSPVDYLVKSLYDPDAQKKEEFVTRILLTSDGQQWTGIVARRDEEKITLKMADGKLVDVPAADIEFEGEGKSLMPEGLVKFMTEQEVLDVVKFLSMLGKPQTPYAIRQTQRMQRWRVLRNPAPAVLERVPDEEVLGDLVLDAETWEAAYSQVNGELPLEELTTRTGQPVVYVQGEVHVTAAGSVGLRIDDPVGVALWVDDTRIALEAAPLVELSVGVHRITLRVDSALRARKSITLELERPAGTTAQFSVVDGA